MKVLHLINELTGTSIPLEIAGRINDDTPAEVVLVSFYDRKTDVSGSALAEGLEVECLNSDSRVDLGAYLELRRIARERSVDVLHTHHNSVGSMARSFLLGTDLAVVNTEHRSHESFSWLQVVANAVSYPTIDVMVANSRHTLDSVGRLERRLLTGTNRCVVYNGVDLDRVDQGAGGRVPVTVPSGPVVTTVGRMVGVKNQTCLIRAFDSVLESRPDATLLVVGDGPLREDLVETAASLGISESVRFTGSVPRETVYALLHRSSVFVVPSLSEGFCVAAVEAMAAGLPVVASDIEVLREVVGDPGLFVPPDDPDSFGDAITGLLDAPETRERHGTEARERARSTFSLDRTVREYYNIYENLTETS